MFGRAHARTDEPHLLDVGSVRALVALDAGGVGRLVDDRVEGVAVLEAGAHERQAVQVQLAVGRAGRAIVLSGYAPTPAQAQAAMNIARGFLPPTVRRWR